MFEMCFIDFVCIRVRICQKKDEKDFMRVSFGAFDCTVGHIHRFI